MEKITDAVMSEKPRYAILDGLRGVAAVIVVAFHLFETYSKGPAYQILNHGYLAVDFFFVLSGFVKDVHSGFFQTPFNPVAPYGNHGVGNRRIAVLFR